MEICHPRDCLLHAMLDVSGGRLGPLLDPDQVVDDTHPRELTDCALSGASLGCRLDLSVQSDAPVTYLRPDLVGDLGSPALQMRDLLGDLLSSQRP